jgi:hypothetical protein
MAATQALREIIESGVAPAAMDEISGVGAAPQLKMIDQGVVPAIARRISPACPIAWRRGDRAGTWHSRCSRAPPATAGRRSRFMEKIKLQADEGPALELSPHVASAGERPRRAPAQHARTVTPSRRSRASVRRARSATSFMRSSRAVAWGEQAQHIRAACSDAPHRSISASWQRSRTSFAASGRDPPLGL